MVASGKIICAKVRLPECMQDIDDVVVYFLQYQRSFERTNETIPSCLRDTCGTGQWPGGEE